MAALWSRKTLTVLALGAGIGALVLVVPTAAARPPKGAGPSRDPPVWATAGQLAGDEGRLIYLRDCAWCHGTGGEGTLRGPSLSGVGAASTDFMLSTGRMPIRKPENNPPHRPAAYTRTQIDAVDGYVASFGPGPAIPVVDPASGDLAVGATLYEANCAACHSSSGAGGALTQGLYAPSVLDSTPVEIAEAIRLGGAGLRSGNMPKFGPDIFDQSDLDSVVAYVLYLQHPKDRGGLPLGRIGPVAEGFVAWVIGLLALVLVVRWIGERG